jgi:FkbM family methyltransferase
VQSAARTPSARIDGFRLAVDHERWSPKLVRRVLSGRYEVEERRLIPRVLSPDDRVLDIGAGIGLVAMLCARVVGPDRVFAYEANPEIVACARHNFQTNGLPVSLAHAAVVGPSHAGDGVEFFLREHFWSSSLIDPGAGARRVVAPAVALRELLERHAPSVIVADVEGAECELFEDVDLSGVDKLCIECHTRYLGARKVSDLVASLLARGFVLHLTRCDREVLFLSRDED